jgi:hypothetical protein
MTGEVLGTVERWLSVARSSFPRFQPNTVYTRRATARSPDSVPLQRPEPWNRRGGSIDSYECRIDGDCDRSQSSGGRIAPRHSGLKCTQLQGGTRCPDFGLH